MKSLSALLVLSCATALAHADAGKRALPDYDGRGPQPDEHPELWVARAALAPAYLASEYLVRRPMGFLVRTGEANHWPSRIIDLFTFDPERKTGLVPTFYVERGFHPTIGFYGFGDDLFARGNALRVFGSFGYGHHDLSVRDRLTLGGGALVLGVRGTWAYREDNVYYGSGPESREEDRARYGLRRLEAAASLAARPARPVTVSVEAGARGVRLGSGCCDDPSLDEAVAAGTLPPPPGLAEGGATGGFGRLALALDTRTPSARSGLIVNLDAEGDLDTEHDRRWLRWGGTAGAVWDVGGKNRLLGLSLTTRFADGDVPFYDLASLGGSGPLRGFAAGRLVGRSGIAATAVYEWPVSPWLHGVLDAGVGNAFSAHLDDFRPELLRFSTGFGLRTRGEGHRFEVLVALGTRTFADGGDVEGVRLVVGGTQMF